MLENAQIGLDTFIKISLFSKQDFEFFSACFFTRMCFYLDFCIVN